MAGVPSSHKRLLAGLTFLCHLKIIVILVLSSQLPSFDSSASLVLENTWLSSLLRWDAFHYAHIAQSGYVYEYEYAFFPGVPTVMRLGAQLLQSMGILSKSSYAGPLLAGAFASTAIAIDAIYTLYDLSLHHFQSPHTALLVSLLSLLSSSPVTLRFASYAEPFFTYLSYKGMLYCANGRFVHASASFTLASFFRSNGTMLAGYILWGMLFGPILCNAFPLSQWCSRRFIFNSLKCLLLSAIPMTPFLWHQYNGHIQFCDVPSDERRSWCTKTIPLIYSFVQSEYWDVGLFRYWTLQQMPNILLASPILALLVYGSVSHIRGALFPRILNFLRDNPNLTEAAATESGSDPFLDPSLTPHAIHALVLSVVLLTSAHTQIALRLVSAMPFTYWTAVWLFFPKQRVDDRTEPIATAGERDKAAQDGVKTGDHHRAARWWVGWSMVWEPIALVTWGVFLPPA